MQSHNEDTGWAWVVALAAMMTNCFMIGFSKSFGLFFVEFLETFNSSSSATSIIFGSQGIAFSLGSVLVMTVLINRVSCRFLVIVGGFLFGLAIILSSIAQSLAEAIIYMGIISGFGQSFIVGPSMVMLGQYFKKRLGLATGIAICGGSFGQFILPPLLQYTMDRYSFRGGLLILGGMFLNCMVCGALMRPLKSRPNAQKDLRKIPEKGCAPGDPDSVPVGPKRTLLNQSIICETKNGSNGDYNKGSQKSLFKNLDKKPVPTRADSKQESDKVFTERETCNTSLHLGHVGISCEFLSSMSLPQEPQDACCKCRLLDCSLLKSPLFLVTLLSLVFGYVGVTTQVVFLPPYAKDVGLRNDQIPLLLSIMGGCDLVGRIVLGCLADSSLIPSHRILMLSLLIQGVVAFVTFQAVTFWGLVAVSLVNGLFGGVLVSLITVVLTDFYGPQRLPQTLGIIFMFQGTALCLINPLLGWLRDFTGSYLSTFCLIGGLLVVSGMSLSLVPCCQKRSRKVEVSIDVQPVGALEDAP